MSNSILIYRDPIGASKINQPEFVILLMDHGVTTGDFGRGQHHRISLNAPKGANAMQRNPLDTLAFQPRACLAFLSHDLDSNIISSQWRFSSRKLKRYSSFPRLPGTAKSTLSGAFVEAACRRGEPTIFFSFDSDGSEVIQNLKSVGIRLERFVKSGLLRMVSARSMGGSAENILVRIKTLARDHQARCLVIDPVSTLAKAGNELTAHVVAERLVDWAKSNGTTLVCTSLLDEMSGHLDGGTQLQISTMADTWIHLNYLVQSGERNRGLSIIKSRGTTHSNQVRELILSDTGVTPVNSDHLAGAVVMHADITERKLAEETLRELPLLKCWLHGSSRLPTSCRAGPHRLKLAPRSR
jgi:KaiC/GvpD/RAD55 family RecA-like ATPase